MDGAEATMVVMLASSDSSCKRGRWGEESNDRVAEAEARSSGSGNGQ